MPKISELTPASALTGLESVPVTQDGSTRKATVSQIATATFSGFGANTFPARASAGALEAKPITDYALTLLDDANATAARTTLGAGTVNSVSIANATGISWTGGPITDSGSITPELSANLQAWHATSPTTYTGSATIATLGTVTTGTWNGTAIAANRGGTGQTVYAVGDLLYASTTTALSKLADVATGNALISGGVGVAPSWGKIALTTHVSGTLPVGNGGTGIASYTAGNYINASGATTLQQRTPAQVRTDLGVTNTSSTFFRATRTTDQNFSAGAFTTVIFATETADPDSAYNTSTGEYTAPRTGIYNLCARAHLVGFADDADLVIAVFRNGTEFARIGGARPSNAAGGVNAGAQIGGSLLASLTAADVITIRVFLSTAQGGATVRVLGDASSSYFTAIQE